MGLPLHETAQLLARGSASRCKTRAHAAGHPGQLVAAGDARGASSRTARCRNCISNARWSAAWSATSISARWRACCPACSRPSSTSAWSARPSCTWPTSAPPARRRAATAVRNSQPQVPIEKLVFEGQALTVQVIKDPIGTKGARLSTQISIAGPAAGLTCRRTTTSASRRRSPQEPARAVAQARCTRWSAAGGRRRLHPAHQWPKRRATGTGRGHRLPAQDLGAHPGSAAKPAGHLAAAPGPEPAAARAARPRQRGDADHPHRLARAVRDAAGLRRGIHAGGGRAAGSTTRASGRSSTCTPSRRRSRGRWAGAST